MDARRVIAQLRAKADSTTFPHEAEAFRARADRLEAKYFPPGSTDDHDPIWSRINHNILNGGPVRPDERDYWETHGPAFGAPASGGPFSGRPRVRENDAAWAHADGIIFDGGPLVDGQGHVQPNGSTVFRTRSGMKVTFIKPQQA
jgi:Protein of unknown function (DUF2786)